MEEEVDIVKEIQGEINNLESDLHTIKKTAIGIASKKRNNESIISPLKGLGFLLSKYNSQSCKINKRLNENIIRQKNNVKVLLNGLKTSKNLREDAKIFIEQHALERSNEVDSLISLKNTKKNNLDSKIVVFKDFYKRESEKIKNQNNPIR